MALSEARVSLAWISRVSEQTSGEMVKRFAEGGLGVIFFMMKLPHCLKGATVSCCQTGMGGSCTRVDRPEV